MTARCVPDRSASWENSTPPHGWKAKGGGRSTATGVFVEVKTRRTMRYGTPQEAVTASKQINLRHAAVQWLTAPEHRMPNSGVRFDVVTVVVQGDRPLLHHIEGAF